MTEAVSTDLHPRPSATRSSIGAIVLAALATMVPLTMIVLYVAWPPTGDIGAGILAIFLWILFEVLLAPTLAAVAFALAIVNRKRSGASRRNSTIALTIIGIGVTLVVLQVLLYLPH
jgi:hypothetical protein